VSWRTRAALLEVADDLRVGLEDVLAGPVGHLVGEAALLVDRAPTSSMPCRLADALVVLAEAGAMCTTPVPSLGVDEVAGEHPEGVRGVGEVVEQRLVGAADQLGAGEGADHARALELGS
jgi:hypothetical protein